MKNIDSGLLDKKYFIFDLDGTLIDSMGMWNLVDQKVLFDNFGVEVNQEDIKIFRDAVLYDAQNIGGDIYNLYYESLINFFNLGISSDEFKKLRYDLSNKISIYGLDYKSGADKFLNLLKQMGKKIGVATTTTKKQYEIYGTKNIQMIQKAPLKKLVDAVVLCEDVQRKKPDPEAYLLVMNKLGAKPEECIVFEDSLNGILAAKNAGIEVCAVFDKSAQNEQDVIDKIVDFKIDSFDQLIDKLNFEKMQIQPE